MIRCLHDGIIFAMLQEQNVKGVFIEKTKSGIELIPGQDSFQKNINEGRWAKVLAIGPKCEEVVIGDYICIEPKMWTNPVVIDGVKIRKTDESKVMIVSKEKPNTLL